jgi:phosphonate transport system substrate-binding protein
MRILLQFCLLCAMILSLPAQAAEAPEKQAAQAPSLYTVTVVPYYSPEKIWTKFSPLIDYLRKTTGQPWQLKLFRNHESLLEGLCSGEVSFALVGPVPLARVIDRCGAGVAAVALGRDGKPFYQSVLLTADPRVTSPGGLKGHPFALFKGSTASHVYALKMLHDAGLKDDDIMPVYFESQDHIMNALLAGSVSGAGVKMSLYEKFRDQPLRVLMTSNELPGFAFAVAPGLNEAVRKQFTAALLRLHPLADESDRRLVKDWDDEIKNGFILPPAGFDRSVAGVFAVYREILHEH